MGSGRCAVSSNGRGAGALRKRGSAMLLLEKLLEGLDIRVKPFALCRAAPGTSLPMPRSSDATIHYVLSGAGQITLKGHPRIELSEGTMVIVPARTSHELIALKGEARGLDVLTRCDPLASGLQIINVGSGENGVVMACGLVGATYQGLHGIFDYLPAPIVEHAEPGETLRHAFENLLRELADPQPGSETMVKALMQQCLVAILRKHCESGRCQVPWLSALEDPRLHKALGEVLTKPGRPYTVELLAEIAGMGRSAFSEHFARTFGRSPMDFVKEVRLRQAARLLRHSNLPSKSIAARVGYESRSHLSQAFKDFFGVTPAAYRARDRASAAPRQSIPTSEVL
jgi:AraC family transcriptional regulator, activator of mtrCDE